MDIATEIRSFYSLKELRRSVEEEIAQYKDLIEDYSQWLGSFLRNPEITESDRERLKKLSGMERLAKTEVKGKRGKTKSTVSSDWVPFKNLMLCATEQGEAEILFEAIEEMKSKVERLEKIKSNLEDLERAGLGKDVTYVTFIHDGIPEKIVLRHRKDAKFAEKFKFIADFSVSTS